MSRRNSRLIRAIRRPAPPAFPADGAKVLFTENAQLNTFHSGSESREPGVWLNVEITTESTRKRRDGSLAFGDGTRYRRRSHPKRSCAGEGNVSRRPDRRNVSAYGPEEEASGSRIPRAGSERPQLCDWPTDVVGVLRNALTKSARVFCITLGTWIRKRFRAFGADAEIFSPERKDLRR
jgi:hypothetical protein